MLGTRAEALFLMHGKEVRELIQTVLLAIGIPSAITGFCFWCLERKLMKRQWAEERKEEARRCTLLKESEVGYNEKD